MKANAVSDREAEYRRVTLRVLEEVFPPDARRRVRVRLWDGTVWPDSGGAGAATIVLRHPGALRAMFLPGDEVGLAEAYLFDDFDIEGDVESVVDLATGMGGAHGLGWLQRVRSLMELRRLPADSIHPGRVDSGEVRGRARLFGRSHSRRRDRAAIAFHYDVSNQFYGLWLDSRMVYSCAYFRSPEDGIEAAQVAKLDLICRKLRLKPGQRLLDIGCGWGGLILYASKHYGVEATGITLSESQAEYARARIRESGLAGRCRVEVADYREALGTEAFDALVSVGMVEHVGEKMLPVYFRSAWERLKPGGVFLNHGITKRGAERRRAGSEFIEAYVFPDGELIPLAPTLAVAEDAGFQVRDVESLREHYMLTLRRWVARLEAHHGDAVRYVGEPTYRVWRLFMAGSANGFRRGYLDVYQTLLSKPLEGGLSGLPLRREDWYAAVPGADSGQAG